MGDPKGDRWLVVYQSRKARNSRLSLVAGGPYEGPATAKAVADALTKATGLEHRIKPFTGQPLIPPGSAS